MEVKRKEEEEGIYSLVRTIINLAVILSIGSWAHFDRWVFNWRGAADKMNI